MKRIDGERLWDFLGALLGVSCVEWDEDFADDGYRDPWGREPVLEPVFDAYDAGRPPRIEVVDCGLERAARERLG